jgi:nitrogen regulatory protein PII
MPRLVVCVVDDPEKAGEVLSAWVELGVPGVTILDSTGLGHQLAGLGAPDDAPIFPSLQRLLRAREETHRTLLAVVHDSQPIEQIVEATETIVGKLDAPDTGILFVLPVERAWGLRKVLGS